MNSIDKQKLKTLAHKIYYFTEAIRDDQDIHPLELDLLKGYLLQMYEIVVQTYGSSPSMGAQANTTPSKDPTEKSFTEFVDSAAKGNASSPSNEAAHTPPSEYEEARALIDRIFESFEIHELSDKLRFSPIDDIHRAMSINERIFTIRELFNGNQEAFRTIIDKVNNAADLEQAKEILAREVVYPFQWNEPEKYKKIQHFLTLVKRRFNHQTA